jgi:hypothetical protein
MPACLVKNSRKRVPVPIPAASAIRSIDSSVVSSRLRASVKRCSVIQTRALGTADPVGRTWPSFSLLTELITQVHIAISSPTLLDGTLLRAAAVVPRDIASDQL